LRTDPSTATDSAIARVAARQHGLVTRAQLLDMGLTPSGIQHRRARARLHGVHCCVYAVGCLVMTAHARALAAVLACGPDAVLSHRSAAGLWELVPAPGTPVDVIAVGKRQHRGVVAHRSRTLAPGDVARRWGIPVTTPLRTLVDLADVVDDATLDRAVNEALLLRLVRREDLAGARARAPGRQAVTRLQPFVEVEDAPTRSVLEDAFLALVERHGLPRPEVNQRIAGYEVDMLWRAERLVVELDGRAAHDRSQAFERDRERDAELMGAGFRVVRITWRRLREQPERELSRLSSLVRS
jgi:very-short-patch-repair endonuclease